ncbi:fused uroporphyrinogen-III synthase HemD/membrane protein HemX [Trinickia acidisoli]|uniref:fused uroporphyrinogen-III synthase HemD/membrane protein HemX n=1 Tax=Trinickia acidisoli TaxID=2767482 RepID=UPI001A8EC815|nr:fused uroporphyrinogen-III synthase HemD/membrane protein HemX [Trinickia acidisoli]
MTNADAGSPRASQRDGAARFTAVLTRPAGQSAALAAALEREGIAALDFPLIEIAAAADDGPLRAALASLERYALVVFVSPNAIERALGAVPGFAWPAAVPIGVVGPGSVAELARHGIVAPTHQVIAPAGAEMGEGAPASDAFGAAGTPACSVSTSENGNGNGNGANGESGTRFDSEALFAALSARLGLAALTGRPVLIVRGDGGREWLADRLRESGAQVEAVCAYRRVVPTPSADTWERVRALLGGAPHAWLITSSEAARNLDALARAALTDAELASLLHAPLVAPHPRIAETARAVGFDTITASGPGDARILGALRALSASSRASFDQPAQAAVAQAAMAQAFSSTHPRMTDTNQESSPASFQPAATPPFTPPMPPVYDAPRRGGGGLVWIFVILLAIATGVAAFAFNRKLDRLDTQLAARQQALDAQTAELRVKTEQAVATAHETDAALSQMQGKLADAQTAQQALQQQYQDLAQNRDDWTFAEVEQMLSSASEQLQLTGNTQLALFALQSADSRLAASASPQALVVRRAIAQDIDTLKAAPSTDLTGLAIKLDDAIAQIDTLPLLGEAPTVHAAAPAGASAAGAASAAGPGQSRVAYWWHVFSRAASDELKGLVQVRRLDNADAMLNSPQQAEFIRDNVKLRLLSARLGLLSRNQATLESDLNAADAALARYFDGASKRTQTVRALIKDVGQGAATVEVPNLNTSLQAIHNAKSRG